MNDDVHPPRLVIVWRITEQCNLNCHFCGYSRALNRSRRSANSQQVIMLGEMLHDYRAAFQREVLVSWIGGEPLLWQPLTEVAQYFKRELKLKISITTNGVGLCQPEMREHIVADYDQIVLSVDGLAELHDRVRDARGLFAQIKSNVIGLNELKKQRCSRLSIAVNTVLMHGNVRAFELLCDELASWGVQEITFNTLGGRDRPEFYPQNRLTPEDVAWWCDELPSIRERMNQRGVQIRGNSDYLGRIVMQAHDQAVPVMDCSPAEQFLFVDECGVIAPCNFTVHGYGIALDDIRRATDLHHLPTFFAARKHRELLAPCCDCRSTQVFGKFLEGV